MTDDLISRAEAIEAIKEYLEEYDGIDHDGYHDPKWCAMMEARTVIESLPTASPRWIPVTERLPEEDEIVYNSIGIKGERDVSDRVLAIDSTGFVRCGYFMKSCSKHEYHGNGKRNKYSDYGKASWAFGEHYESKPKNWIVAVNADIVAWMPVPLEGENDVHKQSTPRR